MFRVHDPESVRTDSARAAQRHEGAVQGCHAHQTRPLGAAKGQVCRLWYQGTGDTGYSPRHGQRPRHRAAVSHRFYQPPSHCLRNSGVVLSLK